MSCHYSCSTCSGNLYLDLCTSCPANRYLSSTLCLCSDGFYQYQNSQCQRFLDVSILDSIIIPIQNICYYVAIGLHLLSIVFVLNRLISPKLKKMIDVTQVIGLIAYYRFRQEEVAERALKIANAFNFNYLTTLICDNHTPQYGCSTFQSLIGPGLTLLLFILLFFFSFFIAVCMFMVSNDDQSVIYIRNNRKEQRGKSGGSGINFTLSMYWQTTKRSFILLYLDQTAVQTSVALSQLAISNSLGILVVLPFLLLVVIAVRLHFKTINNPAQTTLLYRAEHLYFFIYDKFYHYNYIDHIFQKENLKKNDRLKLKRPFYPESNLIIIELLFKILLGTSTIIFYQYSPYLFAYLCIFLLAVFIFSMDHLFYYEKSTLFFYIICVLAQIYATANFYNPSLFTYFIAAYSVATLILIIVFLALTIYDWKSQRDGQMIVKVYQNAEARIKDQSEEWLDQHKAYSDTQIISHQVTNKVEKQQQPPQQPASLRHMTANRTGFQRKTRQSMGLSKKEPSEVPQQPLAKQVKPPTAKEPSFGQPIKDKTQSKVSVKQAAVASAKEPSAHNKSLREQDRLRITRRTRQSLIQKEQSQKNKLDYINEEGEQHAKESVHSKKEENRNSKDVLNIFDLEQSS